MKCEQSIAYDPCNLNAGIQCEKAYYDMSWTWTRENCAEKMQTAAWFSTVDD